MHVNILVLLISNSFMISTKISGTTILKWCYNPMFEMSCYKDREKYRVLGVVFTQIGYIINYH
jgi:hypothetical protein